MLQINSTTYDFTNTPTEIGYLPISHVIEVGDSKQSSFFPQIKISFWDNEINFSMRLLNFGNGAHVYNNGLVIWAGNGVDCHFIEEGDDFDFLTVLNSQPPSNILTYSLEIKSLVFYKQHDISNDPIGLGEDTPIQPINCIDSYAVFHDSKINNTYGTGKAFHIYRPEAVDAVGNSVWCGIDINPPNKLLTKTIPKSFLDTAIYPVTIK